MDQNVIIFCYGLGLLILFAWYLFSDSECARRVLGSTLAVLLTALCLWLANPPKEKVQLGIDLRGGTSFLVRLVAEEIEVAQADGTFKKEIREVTPSMIDQAVEVIRKRVDSLGTSEPVIAPQGRD